MCRRISHFPGDPLLESVSLGLTGCFSTCGWMLGCSTLLCWAIHLFFFFLNQYHTIKSLQIYNNYWNLVVLVYEPSLHNYPGYSKSFALLFKLWITTSTSKNKTFKWDCFKGSCGCWRPGSQMVQLSVASGAQGEGGGYLWERLLGTLEGKSYPWSLQAFPQWLSLGPEAMGPSKTRLRPLKHEPRQALLFEAISLRYPVADTDCNHSTDIGTEIKASSTFPTRVFSPHKCLHNTG